MICAGVSIEMSLAKDQSLTVVVSGKTDAVLKARKLIVQNLQTQVIDTAACSCRGSLACYVLVFIAPCGLRGCKN